MSDKSEQKKKYIIETAREVFMEKGFKTVTMKDIVERCNISRGGLYLYYESTAQIFLEVLKLESQEADDVFSGNISEDATAAEILLFFLNEQKKELLRKSNTLTKAIYEFYFSEERPKKTNVIKRQFDEGVKIVENLIRVGVENGEFVCDDYKGTARNIFYVLEGLKITAQTMGVTAAMVDAEIAYIMQNLGIELA
ncbi:MAG: TetR/AcrR family transcriptional regulator [Lachnospiraceae bacterium]|nr:TetR/AcrR family transcriptional regulator [Lachnospiraceae bacterium]